MSGEAAVEPHRIKFKRFERTRKGGWSAKFALHLGKAQSYGLGCPAGADIAFTSASVSVSTTP